MSNPQYDNFLSQMYKQQQLGENVDFVIESGEHRIFVHSVFVLSSTPYLRKLLESSCSCDQPTALILSSSFASILPNFVSLLYTGFANKLSDDDLSSLETLANELGFDQLDVSNSFDDNHGQPSVEESEIPVLKMETNIKDPKSNESFNLSFPSSRSVHVFSNLKNIELLHGFQGRVQEEFNRCPVSPYVGPYDQNESLDLSLQLPNSTLNYEKYSEFVHLQNVLCRKFSLSKKYLDLGDLGKIDAIEVQGELDSEEEEESEYEDEEIDEKVTYTCVHKRCEIPCPCAPCSTQEEQCKEHFLKHVEKFDDEKDSICIRSSEQFCRDESFFKSTYICHQISRNSEKVSSM